MGGFNSKVLKRVLAVLFAVLVVGGVAQAVSVDVFNKTAHNVSGAEETQQTFLRFDDRDGSTSTWVKRDYDLYGKTVDLQAQTVDGTLVNNADDTVASWNLTINIEHDCFINNAWTGTVEIHQFVGTDKEAEQTLDLRDCSPEDLKLAYLYDGDLLIPLVKGDYLVYHPSKIDELEIDPHSELTMGMIFYYLDNLDLSNYSVEYQYHRDITYGAGFIALIVLAMLWLLLLVGWGVANVSYTRAKRELDLRKSSLASMSSVYSIISFVDLQKDELMPVYANEKTRDALPSGAGARKILLDIFARDTAGSHRTSALEFVDIETLPERLEKDTIALEYVSESFGWSEVRFFAVDREQGQPLERVLLTIRDINDEKRALERFEMHSARLELESSTRDAFVAGATNGMRVPVGAIDGLADKILSEAHDESVRSYAKQIKTSSKLLGFLIDGAADFSRSGTDDVPLASEEYSLTEAVTDACDIVSTVAAGEAYTIEVDVSPSIPERLRGDVRRIEQALVGIIAYVARRTGAKTVKLSAYGSVRETSAHVLVSVKADGSGIAEEEARALSEFVANVEKYGVYAIDESIRELEGIALLLMFIDAKLHVVNEPEEGVELYFEIDQPIVRDSSSDE